MSTITKGYYRHFKYNPDKEVLGTIVDVNTEVVSVSYRPLYSPCKVLGANDFLSRKKDDFLKKVVIDRIEKNRYELIVDVEEIKRLHRVREKMYGEK